MSLDNPGCPQPTSSATRLEPIISDFEAAIFTLTKVIQFIEETKPDASLRVVIFNNTIVALTAAIEEVLRALFQEYLSVLEESHNDHRTLRNELQDANFECAIQNLKNYKKNGGITAAATIVSNLEKCLNGQLGYKLLKDNLVYNQGNFKSQQVTEISKNVGLSNLWRRICNCSEIEDFTGEMNVDGRVTRLTGKWNEIFEERDLVVHRISQANGWGPDLIQQSLDLSKLVVKRIAICLSIDADQLIVNARHTARERLES